MLKAKDVFDPRGYFTCGPTGYRTKDDFLWDVSVLLSILDPMDLEKTLRLARRMRDVKQLKKENNES